MDVSDPPTQLETLNSEVLEVKTVKGVDVCKYKPAKLALSMFAPHNVNA